MYQAAIPTPIGILQLCADEHALLSAHFIEQPLQCSSPKNAVLEETINQVNAYLDGKLKRFNLPLGPQGTDFQKSVWQELLNIDFGNTRTYLEMAAYLGNTKCIRAAAAANGKNPISIIIPCHRVIGSNRQLVGYAGGLWRKKWLLQHEYFHSPIANSLFL